MRGPTASVDRDTDQGARRLNGGHRGAVWRMMMRNWKRKCKLLLYLGFRGVETLNPETLNPKV